MGVGIGLHLGLNQHGISGAWQPGVLFSGAETGCILDPYDSTTVFQDAAGTTAGVVGSPVLRLRDKSPNRYAFTNSVGPTLRSYGLEFDGVDDALLLGFTLNQPWTCISAIRQKTWTNGDQIHGGGANNAGALLQAGISPQIGIYDGSAIVGALSATLNTWFVVSRFHNGASSFVQLNNGAPTVGNAGTTGPGGLTLGKRPGVETYANYDQGRHIAISRALTAAEFSAGQAWVAAGSGITL